MEFVIGELKTLKFEIGARLIMKQVWHFESLQKLAEAFNKNAMKINKILVDGKSGRDE